MENIGPVAFFVLYMVLSAWAKQRKNKAKAEQEALPHIEEGRDETQPVSVVQNIFDQLKQELFQEEEEGELPFMGFASEPPELLEEVVDAEDYPEPAFVEGTDSFAEHDHAVHLARPEPSVAKTPENPLVGILGAYSTTQQGIILREILGKPRAMQKNEEWFHF